MYPGDDRDNHGEMMLRKLLAILVSVAAVALAGGPLGCDLFKPPESPAGPPPPGGCCARSGALLDKECGGKRSCCVGGGLERDSCELKGGLWFSSPEGCAGGC